MLARECFVAYIAGAKRLTLKELSEAEIAIIIARIIRGDKYSDITSDCLVNQGRISDLSFGCLYPSVAPAKLSKPEERKEH